MAQHIVIEKFPDVLIPVPSHPKSLRSRGYNQALELTKTIAKHHNIPYDYTACQCVKKKRKQSTLSDAERRKNVKGIFQIKQIKSHWQHVVLVDDVVTTGATVNELATIFFQAGVPQVEVWCCARRN
jgi:ComF family protein